MGILKQLFKPDKGTRRDFYCAAVVPAAGSSARMGGENKLMMDIDGTPVIVFTLSALNACPDIDEIVIATRQEDILSIGSLCREYEIDKVTKVVCGGQTRAESVMAGIMELSGKETLIAVHDAARPLVSPSLISQVVRCAAENSAAAPVVAVKDTIKVCRDGLIVSTPERSTLFAVQTPQIFEASLLKGAMTRALESGLSLTDECAAVEAMGMKVSVVEGDYANIKITTREDMVFAQALLEWRLNQ